MIVERIISQRVVDYVCFVEEPFEGPYNTGSVLIRPLIYGIVEAFLLFVIVNFRSHNSRLRNQDVFVDVLSLSPILSMLSARRLAKPGIHTCTYESCVRTICFPP
jgi:hypothetical protein